MLQSSHRGFHDYICFVFNFVEADESNASVNSKHHFEITAPGQKTTDKNLTPGDNFVDLQDNFAMTVKPFAFFWYSSLAWLSSSFFKDYKAYEYKISQW